MADVALSVSLNTRVIVWPFEETAAERAIGELASIIMLLLFASDPIDPLLAKVN